jgi:hypothetical protein
MEWARLLGKRIGRPKVTEQEGFLQRFEAVVERMRPAGFSRGQAARELAIDYVTLKCLLDLQIQSAEQQSAGGSSLPAAADYCGDANAYAQMLH